MNLKSSKFAVQSFSRFLIGCGRGFPGFEISQIKAFTSEGNLSGPKIVPFEPKHALQSRLIILLFNAVRSILFICSQPKIFRMVIRSIHVFMVDFHFRQMTMVQQKYDATALITLSIERKVIISVRNPSGFFAKFNFRFFNFPEQLSRYALPVEMPV